MTGRGRGKQQNQNRRGGGGFGGNVASGGNVDRGRGVPAETSVQRREEPRAQKRRPSDEQPHEVRRPINSEHQPEPSRQLDRGMLMLEHCTT